MNSNRIWIAGASLLAVVILAGGWFLGASPQLAAAATASGERESVETQNQQQEANLSSLKQRYESLGDLNTELASVRAALPTGSDMPTFLREINAAAEATGVTLNSFGTSDDQAFASAAAEAPAEPAAEAPSTGTAEPTADAAVTTEVPTPTDLVPATASIPGGELVSGDNFVTIPITLSMNGSYESLMAFTKAMQTGDRLFLITGLNITSGGEDGTFGIEIEGLTYALLDTVAAPPVDPAVPADASTATVN